MNMSLATNLISVLIVIVGYAIPSSHFLADPIRQIGLYALSGAITNWLAIYMLFERVPGLYGSGVIPSRFEEFKEGIRTMIMGEFFTQRNVENFFEANSPLEGLQLKPEPFLEMLDCDAMFERLVAAILASPYGAMLGMFGGAKALEPMKGPFEENVRQELRMLVESPKLGEAIQASFQSSDRTAEVIAKVEAIVQTRLNELTPKMVKEIVQDMIRKHLGWLVVWGGVFGALLGLGASMLPR